MKHKIAVIVSALFMALTMTACGSSEPASAPSVAENDKAAVQEKLNKQDSNTETTAEKTEDTSAVSEVVPEAVTDAAPSKNEPASDGNHILVAYFSRADENYNVGTIDKGNTQIVAEYIASEVGADSFHIETVTPYPADYDDCCDVAKQELADKARPEIQGGVENMEQYDIVFLGYPIWWGDMPMAVYTFMDSYDFSDKVVIPFNTHEGSGQANTVATIKGICEGADVMSGFSVRGSVAQNDGASARTIVQNWLDTNHFAAIAAKKTVRYTAQDVRSLQQFLLIKSTGEDLSGKSCDLNNDGKWSAVDLTLMKRKILQSQEVDAVSSATITADEREILETYGKFEQAMIDKDIDTLNALVTEDKTFTHMSGKTQTKEEFFGEIADGTLNYYACKLNDPVVTVDGDTATLTGSTTLEAKVYGSSGTWTLTTNQKFVKLDGAWKLSN